MPRNQMAKITAYYNYTQKSGKHILTLSTPCNRNREFIIDTADYRCSSVMDFLTVMNHSTCSLIFDYQANFFGEEDEDEARQLLHSGAVELADVLAKMLAGLMMLRQTPTSSITQMFDLYRRLQAVSGMASLMRLAYEWKLGLHVRPFTFMLEELTGTLSIESDCVIDVRVTGWLSCQPNVRELTGRKVGAFDDAVLADVNLDVVRTLSSLLS